MATAELPWLPTITGEGAAYLDTLQPTVTDGKGLIVFAPVARPGGVDPNFAAGCSRWLFLNAAHDPELRLTPAWYQLGLLPKQLQRTDLRLAPDEARRAAAWTGATHYAVGTAEPGKIVFQVYGPDGKPVGEPVTLAGDPAAMVAALPDAANQLRRRMGLADTRIAPAQETPDDLTLLGRLSLLPSIEISERDIAALRPICPRSVVANLIYFNTPADAESAPEGQVDIGKRLLQLAPGNLIVLAEVARARVLPNEPLNAALNPIAQVAPHNYLLLLSQMNVPDNNHPPITLGVRMVGIASRSSEPWLFLATSQGATSEYTRGGRVAREIPAQDWETLRQLYAFHQATAVRALALNPRSIRAAIEVVRAQITADDPATTYRAIDLCFRLMEHQHGAGQIANLALEAYHPKWGGSQALLQKAATRLVTARTSSLDDDGEVVKELARHDFNREAQQRARAVLKTADARVKADPADFRATRARRIALVALERSAEAVAAARRCVELRPRSAAEWRELVDMLTRLKHPDESIAEAKRFVDAMPQEPKAYLTLCEMLFARERFAEAVEPGRKGLALQPQNHRIVSALAYALQHSGNPAEAATLYDRALGINQNDPGYMLLLGESLCMAKRVPEGRRWFEKVRDTASSPYQVAAAEKLLQQYRL